MPSSITSEKLIDAALSSGLYAYPYSGSFGRRWVAVCGLEPNQPMSAWEIARKLPADLVIPEPRQDALGMGKVLYWPGLEWPINL